MGRYYILAGDAAIEEPDFGKWAAWHGDCYEKVRCIDRTSVKFGEVVTNFLGVNMAAAESQRPLLFETRVLGGWLADRWERYATLAEARAGHQAWVAKVRAMEQEHELPPPDCRVW
jgi:hypothetical protein